MYSSTNEGGCIKGSFDDSGSAVIVFNRNLWSPGRQGAPICERFTGIPKTCVIETLLKTITFLKEFIYMRQEVKLVYPILT